MVTACTLPIGWAIAFAVVRGWRRGLARFRGEVV